MTHKDSYPITAHNADVVVPQLDLEALRALMATAPVYSTDNPEGEVTSLRSYQYGCWPATISEDGLVIAEETVPQQEVLATNGDIDYFGRGSFAVSKFMQADTLASRMSGSLGSALRNIGYEAAQHTTDSRGSHLTTLKLPSLTSFNTQMGMTVSLVEKDANTDEITHLKAYAERGEILVNGEHDMMMVAPVVALLPPAVHDALRTQSSTALASGDDQEIIRAKRNLDSILLNIFGGVIEVATSPNAQQQDINNLGYKLSLLVASQGTELADEGRSLAEQTVRHIYELGSR